MAKKSPTTSDHLTLVVRKRLFGYARNVILIANYKKGIQETVMTTETYYDHSAAVKRAKELSTQLGVKMVVED